MAFIYMDESGDLGFNSLKLKTSDNFIITCLISSSSRSMDKVVKKFFNYLPQKIKNSHCGTFHCHKEKPQYRNKMFSLIQESNDCKIIIVRLNKQKVFTNLQNQKFVLYNYIVNIALDRILNNKIIDVKDSITFIASQRETNKILNENFKNYLNSNVSKNYNINFQTVISHPNNHKGLQIVDACSWAAFRKYEHGETLYYDIISKHIIADSLLFK